MSSDFIWCHGPYCHTHQTQDRIRGSKGSKVLRTRKITQRRNQYYDPNNLYNYFCSMHCYNEFANKYSTQVIRIAPRTEPLETPIDVRTETRQDWNGQDYQVKHIDKLEQVG
mgnify:FL=1|jgi:hypothetical protein